MADTTTKQPVGMIKEVLVRIDKHVIPTEFIILEIREDEKLSIILERPFLDTTSASINSAEWKIVFNIYDEEIV